MPLRYSSKGSGDFKGVPAGNYIAICNMVADLGLQPGTGMYPDPKYQVYIRFEIPAERVDYTDKSGNKKSGPTVIGNAYTASMSKKANLRKQLEGWRGRAFTDEEADVFDIASILGKPCMLNVIEKESGGKTYSNIGSISALPKGMPSQMAENPLLLYTPDEKDSFDKLPEWIQAKIKGQLKPKASDATGVYAEPGMAGNYDFTDVPSSDDSYGDGTGITDEDIPF